MSGLWHALLTLRSVLYDCRNNFKTNPTDRQVNSSLIRIVIIHLFVWWLITFKYYIWNILTYTCMYIENCITWPHVETNHRKTSRHLQCRSSFKTFTSHSAASSMDTWRSSTARSWAPDRQKNEAVIPIVNMFNMWVHQYPQQPTISQPSFCSFYLTIRLD